MREKILHFIARKGGEVLLSEIHKADQRMRTFDRDQVLNELLSEGIIEAEKVNRGIGREAIIVRIKKDA